MPPKIRQLKADLWKAGFDSRPGKGSHVVFRHPFVPALEVTIAGQDGDDADKYQLKQVRNALRYITNK
jgi:predicted RNA binding protein YcfA (HicA-like mRNA interferase family)